MWIHPADASDVRALVLAEVVLYDGSGARVSKQVKLKMSSTCCDIYPGWPGPFPASACNNGVTDDMCHTLSTADDPFPNLNITYPCAGGRTSLSKLEVYNRNGATWGNTNSEHIDSFVIEFLDGRGKPDKSPYKFSAGASTTKYTVLVPGAQPDGSQTSTKLSSTEPCCQSLPVYSNRLASMCPLTAQQTDCACMALCSAALPPPSPPPPPYRPPPPAAKAGAVHHLCHASDCSCWLLLFPSRSSPAAKCEHGCRFIPGLLAATDACRVVIRPTVASSSYNPHLNLGEVLLYDESGEQIPKADILGAKLSSQWDWEAYPASNCINGDLGDFCHTGDGDPSPTLAVVYRCASGATALSKVEVHNRLVPPGC